MNDKIKEEIKKIIETYKCNCDIYQFKNRFDSWGNLSKYYVLSEDFIREFKDDVYWFYICGKQVLSENFMREFKNKMLWNFISANQKLSEDFIREFQDEVSWFPICKYQKLSESFIREFKYKVAWGSISANQNLSEDFIMEFKDEVNWLNISWCQNLSDNFVKTCTLIDHDAYNTSHCTETREEKIKSIKEYAKEYNLQFDGEYLYAYRDHDRWGRGVYNKTIIYEKGEYYRDWHCDMNKDDDCSYGLGICGNGNTKVKVSVDDWGCCVDRLDGKCRVWGFTVI